MTKGQSKRKITIINCYLDILNFVPKYSSVQLLNSVVVLQKIQRQYANEVHVCVFIKLYLQL
jgi:hypothetical protein